MVNKAKKLLNDRGIYFVPVPGSGMLEGKLEVDGLEASFLTEESPYFYPATMLSYYYFDDDTEVIEQLKDEVVVIGDSAGYQLRAGTATREDVNPTAVAEWYDENERMKIGAILDDATVGISTDEWQSKSRIEKHATKTGENIEEMLKVDPDCMLYNVQHGGKLGHMKIWYEQVSDYDLDGWMITIGEGGQADRMLRLVSGLAYLHEKGVKNIHVLGTASPYNIPVMVYAKNYFENVTFDSLSSYFKYWWLFMPHNIGAHVRIGDDIRDDNITGERFPCSCPVCKNLDVSKDRDKNPKRQLLYQLHNMYQIIQYTRQIEYLRGNKELLFKFLDNEVAEKYINLLDDCVEMGTSHVLKEEAKVMTSLEDI